MPAGASNKRERQYEHIKESYEERGQKGRAKEIAARTVNKTRAEHGETQGAKASGSGPKSSAGKRSSKPQAQGESRSGRGDRTRSDLYEEARRKGISGRSTMNKAQLERALGR